MTDNYKHRNASAGRRPNQSNTSGGNALAAGGQANLI